MTQYLIPTNEEFIEEIARSIALDKFLRDVNDGMNQFGKMKVIQEDEIRQAFNEAFNKVWISENPADELSRESYRAVAITAIRAINLKLLTIDT